MMNESKEHSNYWQLPEMNFDLLNPDDFGESASILNNDTELYSNWIEWLTKEYWDEEVLLVDHPKNYDEDWKLKSAQRWNTDAFRHNYSNVLSAANTTLRKSAGLFDLLERAKWPKTIDGEENWDIDRAQKELQYTSALKVLMKDIVNMNVITEKDKNRRNIYKSKWISIPDYNAFQFLTASSEYPELDRHETNPNFKELLYDIYEVKILDITTDLSAFFDEDNLSGEDNTILTFWWEKYKKEDITLITYIKYLLENSDDDTTKQQFKDYFNYLGM